MKTKAMILGAALGVAGLTLTQSGVRADTYSENAVGYVNVHAAAGLNILSNPLNGTPENDLNTLLRLPASAVGATIYRFIPEAQGFGAPIQFVDPELGWISFDPDPAWTVIHPGEGFFLHLSSPETITWVGEVPQGELSNPLPGGGQISIRASQVPQEAPLGSPGVGLEFPAIDADTAFIWDAALQNYKQPYQYVEGLGWLSSNPDDTGLDGPVIPVGTGFFILKEGDPGQSWDRSFSVND